MPDDGAASARTAQLARFRGRLQAGQRALHEAHLATGDAEAMLRGRCALIDELLHDLWHELAPPAGPALVAVGGYGRGELYPASDIDLLILLPAAPDAALQAQLETMIGLFWDVGLEIGHSVRTLEECLAEAAGDV